MATATLPKNKSKVWRKMLMCFQTISPTWEDPIGAATARRIQRSVWVSAGAPSGAIPTGMVAGDLILDTTNDEVYRYITATTYVNMTADT